MYTGPVLTQQPSVNAESCMMCAPCFQEIERTPGKHHLFAWNQEHSRIDGVCSKRTIPESLEAPSVNCKKNNPRQGHRHTQQQTQQRQKQHEQSLTQT